MSAVAGVDIGSTASKAVILVDDQLAAHVVGPSSTNPSRTAETIFDEALGSAGLSRDRIAYVIGTGYGRTQVPFADKNVSEITCHARGAHHLRPLVRTVIDIGGQDTKVMSLDPAGNLVDFATNDKCAAGTGRFLEAMARSMDISLEQMGECYFGEGDACRITSMCSVFAESEVINLINDGVALSGIVKGLLLSLANRVSSMALRVGVEAEVAMTGGVAKSRGVRDALEKKLRIRLQGFDGVDPQLVGAYGAALIAGDFASDSHATR